MVTHISGSHYSGGPTPPENAFIFNGGIVDDSYIQFGSSEISTLGYIRSGGGDSYFKLTPNLGEGLTVEVDLSGMDPEVGGFYLNISSHEPPYTPGGVLYPSTAHSLQLAIARGFGIAAVGDVPDRTMQFSWQGWAWGDDPYELSPIGQIVGYYEPEAMRWLSLCFDGSDLASGAGYWALKVGGTQSALHVPTGEMIVTGSGLAYAPHLFRTPYPMWFDDFAAQASIEPGIAEMPYWHIESQYMPLGYPWAIAGEDGTWHGTYNLVAGRYDVGPADVDWSNTYPVRLG
jgi:hypothetical protein